VRTALVTGVAGQDGIYLARSLRASGLAVVGTVAPGFAADDRSEEHTSDLQSRETISYAVFCLKKKKKTPETQNNQPQNTT